jgi:hypothetical protein
MNLREMCFKILAEHEDYMVNRVAELLEKTNNPELFEILDGYYKDNIVSTITKIIKSTSNIIIEEKPKVEKPKVEKKPRKPRAKKVDVESDPKKMVVVQMQDNLPKKKKGRRLSDTRIFVNKDDEDNMIIDIETGDALPFNEVVEEVP